MLSHPLLEQAIEVGVRARRGAQQRQGRRGRTAQALRGASLEQPGGALPRRQGKATSCRARTVSGPRTASRSAWSRRSRRPGARCRATCRSRHEALRRRRRRSSRCTATGKARRTSARSTASSRTTSAWRGKAEVVEVVYRPDVITKQLTAKAQAKSRKPVAADGLRVAKASDQQHALNGTPFARLKLTPMQRTKAHASLHAKTDPLTWLTPRSARS